MIGSEVSAIFPDCPDFASDMIDTTKISFGGQQVPIVPDILIFFEAFFRGVGNP